LMCYTPLEVGLWCAAGCLAVRWVSWMMMPGCRA